MKNLLEIVTKCIDEFSINRNITRRAAIIGGEGIILHGIPRTTLDVDIIFFCGDEKNNIKSLCKVFADYLEQNLKEQFKIEIFEASKDPSDPLRHDLIIITDLKKQFKKFDILIANYKWELEGLLAMDVSDSGPLQPFPKPHLVGMKLMAGGLQDEEDIRSLFFIMSDLEKENAWELARLIRRDKNLKRIIAEGGRPGKDDQSDSIIEKI
jgi:hypothetical protein